MSTCDPYALSAYLDGELLLPERTYLERHLGLCERCRDELRALNHLDLELEPWGQRRRPLPTNLELRVRGSVEKRKRLTPLLAFSRMMPAAVGSCVAALLVVLTANLGSFQVASRPTPTGGPGLQSTLVSQSSRLSSARRATAILGGRMPTVHPDTGPRHRVQLDVE